jgi:hypothetical protein
MYLMLASLVYAMLPHKREGHTLACVYMSIVDQRGRLPGRWTCWLPTLLALALATYCEERDHSVGYRLHTPRRIQMIMWS